MLSDPRDVVRMRDGIRRQARILRQAPIAAIAEDIRYPLTGHTLADIEAMDDAGLDLSSCRAKRAMHRMPPAPAAWGRRTS